MALVLARIFWLKLKASNAHNKEFKQLSSKDQLAVLKECLLNSPAEINLHNLKIFLEKEGIHINEASYRPFIKQQQDLRNQKNAIEEDNKLFVLESQWLDQIRPFEFNEAEAYKTKGDIEAYISTSLEGINRLYSDEAIQEQLTKLFPSYPKARSLLNEYKNLTELRDSSTADDESLEQLRKAKETWVQNLLKYEP